MKSVCVINVVGLTPELLKYAPNIASLGSATPWTPPVPAVTCTSQATLLTGSAPSVHGIVANGWYFRETAEIRFWQQSRNLIESQSILYDGIETAKIFWWFNQHSGARWSVTPKPHYGCDGAKVFDIIDRTDCNLTQEFGAFPFFTFWGPNAGLPCSEWISKAAWLVIRKNKPSLTLVYLPHLDYDFQRLTTPDSKRVEEVDRCAKRIIDACGEVGTIPIVVSEYGLVPVSRPIYLNRILRQEGWLDVRNGPFGEMLMAGDSKAFAVVDHQVAHVYVRAKLDISHVRNLLEQIEGVDRVVDPSEIGLGHRRSGELIALAKPDSWFCYYYWLDDKAAPDFARTVDIHRKPGYDPVELFMTSKLRALARIAQKKLGFRYKMDVIPLDATLVKGSHGVITPPEQGPLVIGPNAPERMELFANYVRNLLGHSPI
jgi:predicted AlkP superfamily pyrophosphatase or phosphodiesterase